VTSISSAAVHKNAVQFIHVVFSRFLTHSAPLTPFIRFTQPYQKLIPTTGVEIHYLEIEQFLQQCKERRLISWETDSNHSV
jgi:hypothetical protein